MRLPQVHDTVRQGLVLPFIDITREKRLAAYVDAGVNRWPTTHVLDVAKLYVLALEQGQPSARHHAVAEDGVPVREITASSSADSTVDFGTLGPVFRSVVEVRFFHFATVFGLSP